MKPNLWFVWFCFLCAVCTATSIAAFAGGAMFWGFYNLGTMLLNAYMAYREIRE